MLIGLVIAGAGALLILLIMVAAPAARRGRRRAAPARPTPPSERATFRARPMVATGAEGMSAPAVPTPAGAEVTAAEPLPQAEPEPVAIVPEPEAAATAPEPGPAAALPEPPAAAPEPEPVATGTELAPISQPEPEAVIPDLQPEPQPEPDAGEERAAPALIPDPLPSNRFAVADPAAPEPITPAAAEPIIPAAPEPITPAAGEPITPAAAEPVPAAVALADRPGVRSIAPARTAEPPAAPDLISALTPAVVLGDAFDPERLRASMRLADAPETGSIEPETSLEALLRDHSLAVPVGACLAVGLTVRFLRARRR